MKYKITVTQEIEVIIPKRAMTKKFLNEFASYMYPFKSEYQHAEHLAQLACRGLIDRRFVEGYGDLEAMGVTVGEPEVVEIDSIVRAL